MNKMRWTWLVAGWVWVVVTFYVSLMPHPPEPVTFWGMDKLEHALTYACLMLWFGQIYRRRSSRFLLAALLLIMGVAIEFLQRETGYRTFEYADMVANATGIIVGWAWARTGLGRIFAFLEYHSDFRKHKPH